ncbi:MAG: hypothetical protein EBT78_13275 [Betaproteobacteria bacterium]|nr:hypothetical protein [Betaproteobacteria bacterium]NBT68717.1 hypothetical protein [Betaproteobacteria bacterium]NBY07106.1 hypothetical protein [Betaproteobacteria bacterium]
MVSLAPCEGTSYEIGGIALIKGARNTANAKRYYDWLMSPIGQAIGGKANSCKCPPTKHLSSTRASQPSTICA